MQDSQPIMECKNVSARGANTGLAIHRAASTEFVAWTLAMGTRIHRNLNLLRLWVHSGVGSHSPYLSGLLVLSWFPMSVWKYLLNGSYCSEHTAIGIELVTYILSHITFAHARHRVWICTSDVLDQLVVVWACVADTTEVKAWEATPSQMQCLFWR